MSKDKLNMKILGISAFFHDSAAALIIDGKIIAAVQEERFTRAKHDSSFPKCAIAYCLAEAGIKDADLDYVVFYDNPTKKFKRILATVISYAPHSKNVFTKSMPQWLGKKLFLKKYIKKELSPEFTGKIEYVDHHISHAASAFYPSPYNKAAVLTIDGVGEWATATIGVGAGN